MSAGTAHRVRWFVYAGGERIPRTSTMRGVWGYDVECSCGWATTTGGATKTYISNEVHLHRMGF